MCLLASAMATTLLQSEDIPHFDTLSSGGFLVAHAKLLGSGPEVSLRATVRFSELCSWSSAFGGSKYGYRLEYYRNMAEIATMR